MDLVKLTVVSINGQFLDTPINYGIEITDIIAPITNNGVVSTVVIRSIKNNSQSTLIESRRILTVQENLAAIVALSDFFFLADVNKRQNRVASPSYQAVFFSGDVSGDGITPENGNLSSSFYYYEDGDYTLVKYDVAQTVTQITSQTTPTGSFWQLNGNTVGVEKFIGTIDNFDFPIRTFNVERARINATGLGVGVSPAFALDVASRSAFTTAIAQFANTTVNFKLYGSAASPETVITANPGDLCFVDTGTAGSLYQKITGVATNTGWSKIDTAAGDDWNLDGNTVVSERWLGTIDNFDLPFRTNNIEKLRVTAAGVLLVGTTVWDTASSVQFAKAGYVKNESTQGYQFANTTGGGGFFWSMLSVAADQMRISLTGIGDLVFINTVGLGSNIVPTAKFHGKGNDTTSANYCLKLDDSASSPLLYVDNAGGIGLGTATPQSRFHNTGSVTEDKWSVSAGAYVVLLTDYLIHITANGAVTLPLKATAGNGKKYIVFAEPGVTATITANGADNIFGAATFVLVGGVAGASAVVRASSVANEWVVGD